MSPDEKLIKVESLKSRFQQILDDPQSASPEDILGWFFGGVVDYNNNNRSKKEFQHQIINGHCILEMESLWFGNPPIDCYDNMCQSFKGLIEKIAQEFVEGEDWNSTVNGRMAQMLLLDQVSRNAYRGTDQAFAYDALAIEHARVLTQTYLNRCRASAAATTTTSLPLTIQGEFYPPYFVFMWIPFIHSESLENHQMALELLDTSLQQNNKIPDHLFKFWESERRSIISHRQVIERFGRYPHRNQSLGRKNTPEEDEYLEDLDNLPGWAKSQKKL